MDTTRLHTHSLALGLIATISVMGGCNGERSDDIGQYRAASTSSDSGPGIGLDPPPCEQNEDCEIGYCGDAGHCVEIACETLFDCPDLGFACETGHCALRDPIREGSLCDLDEPDVATRPRWSEIGAVPDFENIANNFRVDDSIRLVASAVNKAVTKVGRVRSELEKDEATGQCTCEGNANGCFSDDVACGDFLSPPTGREDCATVCQQLASLANAQLPPLCDATGQVEGWRVNDLFYTPENEARKALQQVEFLDNVVDFITSDGFGDALAAAGTVADSLEDVSDFLDNIGGIANQFTEGFHLGAYSEQRPDLWYCVPRAGDGVFSQMGNLANGRFSIGASFRSGLPAKQINGGFSMAGASIEANGRTYPFAPSVAYNIQMNGFRLFDQNSLFGIEGVNLGGGGLSTSGRYDIFNLIDKDALKRLDTSPGTGDGQVSWLELLVSPFHPVDYTSAFDGHSYIWPRPTDNTSEEDSSIVVFGAGLDLDLDMKTKEIEIPAIPIAPGVTVQPWFTLDAGVSWHNEHDRLRERIEAALDIDSQDFTRDYHAMQAPDSSRDVGFSGHVEPAVGAELTAGIRLARFLQLGVFAGLGLKVSLEPGTYGDTMDTSRGLASYLEAINPPVEAACSPILETTTEERCSRDTHSCEECATYGDCRRNEETVDHDLTEAQCDQRGGIWSPYMCASVPSTEIVGWQGPGCHPLSSNGDGYIGLNSEESAELNALLDDPSNPHHSIFTYALSDLTFEALLDAYAKLQLRLKIWGWSKTLTVLDWREDWDLGSTNKTWFQMGLEAQYEDDCEAPGPVINHQPTHVRKYTAQGTTSHDLVKDWCEPSVAADDTYGDYHVPSNEGVVGNVVSMSELGRDVGLDLWNSNQICFEGVPLWDWLANRAGEGIGATTCHFSLPNGVTFDGPCGEADQLIAQGLGCVDIDETVPSTPAAPSTSDEQFVEISGLLTPNADEISVSNLLPQYNTPEWLTWIGQVEQCLQVHGSVDVTADIEGAPERCCGDHFLSAGEACDPTASDSPTNCTASCELIVCGDGQRQGTEQCDDGNTANNDGCSSSCQREGVGIGDETKGAGASGASSEPMLQSVSAETLARATAPDPKLFSAPLRTANTSLLSANMAAEAFGGAGSQSVDFMSEAKNGPACEVETRKVLLCILGFADRLRSTQAEQMYNFCEYARDHYGYELVRDVQLFGVFGDFSAFEAIDTFVFPKLVEHLDTSGDGVVTAADQPFELSLAGFSWGGVSVRNVARQVANSGWFAPDQTRIKTIVLFDPFRPFMGGQLNMTDVDVERVFAYVQSQLEPGDCSEEAPLSPYSGLTPRVGSQTTCHRYDFDSSQALGGPTGHCGVQRRAHEAALFNLNTGLPDPSFEPHDSGCLSP